MAKEHIYTRVKEGYFTHSEGYDTIALSKGITKEYVNKNIYPFCFYDDKANTPIYYYKYIDNPLNDLQAVTFGRNSYIHSSRNYILNNCIIICEEEELKLLDNNFEQFVEFDSYCETPKVPKILNDVSIGCYFKPYDVFMEREFIFELLSLDEFKYKYLLKQIIKCIERKETLYIKLKCNKQMYSRCAKKLIKMLFINIPKNLKRNLSYITYSSSCELKVFFHIVFLDNSVYVSNDRLCFDFVDCYNLNEYSQFLDFAYKNILCANKIILDSSFYNCDYNTYNLIFYLDKSSTKILESCETKIISSYEDLDTEQYINIVNLFFDLLVFSLKKENLIKSVAQLANRFKKQLEYENSKNLLDTINFLAMKKFITTTKTFLNIVYTYYGFSFEQHVELIKNFIYNASDFEDFIIVSSFYINYMNDLISNKMMQQIYDIVNKRLLYFEKKDLREENVNDLSVYLWTRYRSWI